VHAPYEDLSRPGFVRVADLTSPEEAFARARGLIDRRCVADRWGPAELIGDFVLPPHEGPQTREFQTLHFDFGLPLDPKVEHDVARYTALYVVADRDRVSAVTRLVPLAGLLAQRRWPSGSELVRRLIAYGSTHGAWDDASGYVEGSLARLIEAAAGASPRLPSVKAEPEFLCGLEFDRLEAELAFFAHHGLRVEPVQVEVALQPGELLVFDNLAFAHGRRGIRQPGELHQRVFGHRRLNPSAQRRLRDRVLSAFHDSQSGHPGPLAAASTP